MMSCVETGWFPLSCSILCDMDGESDGNSDTETTSRVAIYPTLIKLRQANACHYSCSYCFTSCAIKRTTFKPDELAITFISLSQTKRVDGLFLSSGIVPDADTTMEKMLATVERLRLREGYSGYIHLKLILGPRSSTLSGRSSWPTGCR